MYLGMLWPYISCLINGTQSCAIHRVSSYVLRVRPLCILPICPCQQLFLSEMAYLMSPFQRPCMFRAGRVDMNVKGCSSWRQVRRGCMFSAGRSVFWCPLVGAESDLYGRKWPVEGSHFRTQQGTCPKSGCNSEKKVAFVGCTQTIFRLGRVKTSVDQSAALIPAG